MVIGLMVTKGEGGREGEAKEGKGEGRREERTEGGGGESFAPQ